jgi:hypothetical protein
VGVRESAQSWRELLVDIKSRGLEVPPEIAVGDGAMVRGLSRTDRVRPLTLEGARRGLPGDEASALLGAQ